MEQQIQKLEELPKTISFSALQAYLDCPRMYKILYVLKQQKFVKNIWTVYGTLLHNSVQDVLLKKISAKDASIHFDKVWTRFCRLYAKQIKKELKDGVDPVDYKISACKAIENIEQAFLDQFGPFKVVNVESWINGYCKSHPQRFAGKLDIAIQIEKDGTFVIADFKSCDSKFFFEKYMDKNKESQLVFYKNFYCKANNIDPKKLETYFITIEKNPKSKVPIGFIRVTSGNIKIGNCMNRLDEALININKRNFICNRTHCDKYGEKHMCPFYNTEFCKK